MSDGNLIVNNYKGGFALQLLQARQQVPGHVLKRPSIEASQICVVAKLLIAIKSKAKQLT